MGRRPHILMIVEHAFPDDARVRKEADALRGCYDITVIALKGNDTKNHEMVNGIEVFRIPELKLETHRFNNRVLKKVLGMASYVLEYVWFTMVSSLIFLGTHVKRRYKVIHAHNPPDTLFLVGLLGKIFFIRFIFDHHDLSPELYITRFSGKKDILYKTLIFFEKMSCKVASVIISTNESYKAIEMSRHHIDANKIFVVRNNPIIHECLSQAIVTDKREKNRNVLLYVGSINPQDGLDILLQALSYLVFNLREENFTCCVLGDGDSLESVKKMAIELRVADFIEFKGYVHDREVVKQYLCRSDICVEPAPYNELNRHSTFIKIMEYMAAGKPIVAFDLKETRYSTHGSALLVPPNDVMEFAHAIKKMMDDPKLRNDLGKAGMKRVSIENWDSAASRLREAYKSLSI